MKKTLLILLILIALIPIAYLSLPFFGINVHVSELISHLYPGLNQKASPEFKTYKAASLETYVEGLDLPRFMYVSETGALLVAEPYKGRIILIPYNQPQKKKVLVSGLKKPSSLDVYQNYLYIAEEDAIGRIAFDKTRDRVSGSYERVIAPLPGGKGHWTRTIHFGPDGYGYVSIGSSCNVCIEDNRYRATISRFLPDDHQLEVYASGLRNSVGFDWSPISGKLYASDNGRDWLGDNFPPDELNLIEKNAFYGWPYANGNKKPDPDYGQGHEKAITESKAPIFEFKAHQAPLGITFIKNKNAALYGKALVALHGSWNRSEKVGYKVVLLDIHDQSVQATDFISGFLVNGQVYGRPVHIVEGRSNELYLSDDLNGRIYRIRL